MKPAPHSTEGDSFVLNALDRVPAAKRGQALEICPGPSSLPELGCRFRAVQTAAAMDALMGLPEGHFDFILAARAFEGNGHAMSVANCFRESARLLRDGGLLCARINDRQDPEGRISSGELREMARDLDFQVLVIEGKSILWRKRAPGWRLDLAEHAAMAAAMIRRLANAWDDGPVVPGRGRYAAMAMWVEGLPSDVDLFDLEVLIGGARGTVTQIGEIDARGWQEVHVTLPYLEQTGLVPVELRWLGERLTRQLAHLRVIPPGPSVPRVIAMSAGGMTADAERMAAQRSDGLTITIEELARPDELTASVNGQTVWMNDSLCTDPVAQCYEVRFRLPEDLAPGVHQILLHAGRRLLAPVTIEIE